MSFDAPMQAPAVPGSPAPPPVMGSAPTGKKPKPKSAQPSFLGTEASPGTANVSNKSLLGQ